MPTMIDFEGSYGPRYGVYEAERDATGKPHIGRTIFTPHEAQIAFFDAREPYVLLHGNRGCGKSRALLLKAVQTCYLVPGCRVAILRKTLPELKKSLWDELLKLPRDLYQGINASDHVVTINAKDRDGTWKPSKIWFVSAQNVEDASKLLSGEYHLILFDEWSQFEYKVWKFIAGSARSPIMRDISGRPTSAQVCGGTTPGGPGAEALRCLFGCNGPQRQVAGEPPSTFKAEQFRAIRATLDQNPTYAIGTQAGDDYRRILSGLPAALQAKWLRGDWGAFEGAYFEFNPEISVIPYGSVSASWWDAFVVSLDYGYGASSAAAHLHVIEQSGRMVTIGEVCLQHVPAYEFAQEVVERFIKPTFQGQRRKIEAVYLDPSNFKHIGDGHTIADQINEVLEPFDLGVTPASNDRVGGWQLMYQMLQTGAWKIAHTCPLLIDAIPSRVHDDRHLGDLLKVSGDQLDDVMDSARYGLYSWITANEAPVKLRVRDAIQPLIELARNEALSEAERRAIFTSGLIRHDQMMAECSHGHQPATFGRRRR